MRGPCRNCDRWPTSEYRDDLGDYYCDECYGFALYEAERAFPPVAGGSGEKDGEAEPVTALAIPPEITIARNPTEVLKEAAEVARALKSVVTKGRLIQKIGDRGHLRFEGWQTLGRFYGISPEVEWTRPLFDATGAQIGFEARARALWRGQSISAAEAECRTDEANWRNKPFFQLRSMAQTRASAKALRNVLAWVVVMAGYEATPAEEMDSTRTAATDAPQAETGNNDKTVTLPQQQAIKTLWTARHKIPAELLDRWLSSQYGKPLTAAKASEAIAYLQTAKTEDLRQQVTFAAEQTALR